MRSGAGKASRHQEQSLHGWPCLRNMEGCRFLCYSSQLLNMRATDFMFHRILLGCGRDYIECIRTTPRCLTLFFQEEKRRSQETYFDSQSRQIHLKPFLPQWVKRFTVAKLHIKLRLMRWPPAPIYRWMT